jgi:hypothetical protein
MVSCDETTMVSVSTASVKGTTYPTRGKWLLLGLSAVALWILRIESQSLGMPLFGVDILGKQEDTFYITPKGIVVAYAISITYCHPDDFIADAAAVLQHSIHLVSRRASNPQSSYDYQMVAFVHPDALNCSQSLHQLGYQVFIKDVPVAPAEMKNEELRQEATTTGCCQEKEFLKLYSLTLTNYPIVVHLDLDCLLLQPLDPLFDPMMLPDSQGYYKTLFGNQNMADQLLPIRKHIPDAMWSNFKTIPVTTYFVRDYNLIKSTVNVPPTRVNIQGGFWIVQPNQAVFEEFCAILRDGHGYTKASGWGGLQLPPSHYYGVAQIQGLVSYYYGHVRPGSSVELNKCVYNNMVDNPTRRQACQESTLSGPCQDCRHTPISQIRSIHLTLCQKPWWCPLWIEEPQCSKFHYEWHRIREDFEAQLRPTTSPRAIQNPVNTADMKDVLGRFPRHCTRKGSKGYKPIDPALFADMQLLAADAIHKEHPQ